MRANYHTHSEFCDGRASAADMAAAAARLGYRALGFSSHAPLPFPTSWSVPRDRLGDYVAEVRRLGAAWSGRGLEILLGLEIDWLPDQSSPRDPAWDGLGLDYRIGSVHYVSVGGGRPFTVDGPVADLDRRIGEEAGGDAGAVWSAYYDSLSALIVDGGFEILGHFDLVRKNNRAGRLFDEDSPAYLGAAMGAARLLAGRGIVVEVNVGGMARGKTATPYPALAVLKELRSLGVPITFSADAHAIAHLGSHIADARELARAAGYRGVAVLSGGAWREVGLDET